MKCCLNGRPRKIEDSKFEVNEYRESGKLLLTVAGESIWAVITGHAGRTELGRNQLTSEYLSVVWRIFTVDSSTEALLADSAQ